MASTYRIDLPNRIRKEIYCGKEQRMMDIVPKVLIEPWQAYCLRYWEYPQVARF